MDGNMVRDYMFNLLSALKILHDENVVHRDIKPSNFLFDPVSRTGSLIDLGMCEQGDHRTEEMIAQTQQIAPEVLNYEINPNLKKKLPGKTEGTRGFRAPEILFHSSIQTKAIDVWACGVILLICLTRRYPFFKSDRTIKSIREIACVLGSQRMIDAASECDRSLQFPVEMKGYNLYELVLRLNMSFAEMNIPPSAFDLLEKLLEPSPSKRITVNDALSHPFFTE